MSEEINHEIYLNQRKELKISGVTQATSATESVATLETVMGGMTIKGKKIHVEKLDTQSGEMVLVGEFCEIKYLPAKKPFLKRLFK